MYIAVVFIFILQATQHNLKSKSRGKGPNRFLTVFKRDGSTIIGDDASLPLGAVSLDEISRLLSRNPVTPKERQEVAPYVDRDAESEYFILCPKAFMF